MSSRTRKTLRFIGLGIGVFAIFVTSTSYYFLREYPVAFTETGTSARGTLVEITNTLRIPAIASEFLLSQASLESLDGPSGTTNFLRIKYWTESGDGIPVIASGLVAFMAGSDARTIVSYQHGTMTERTAAPSSLSQEGLLAGLLFASRGAIVLAPDYIGLGNGDSKNGHTYMLEKDEANAVVDLALAAKMFVTESEMVWPGKIFLMGFSQGGHATVAAHRELERMNYTGLEVIGSAPIAGPFNLLDVSIPYALSGRSPASSMYLAYISRTYANRYNHGDINFMNSRYADSLATLFDGFHPADQIEQFLPNNPLDMFNRDMASDFADSDTTWFEHALLENSVTNWTALAPIRMYYGMLDLDVSSEDSQLAAERMRGRGGNVTAISVGQFDHEDSVFEALPLILTWLNELSRN